MTDYTFTNKRDKKDDNQILVSKILTGPHKNNLIYITSDKKNAMELETDKMEELYEYINENRIRISQNKLNELAESVKNDEKPEDKNLLEIYNSFTRNYKKNNEIKLMDGTMEAMPQLFKKGFRDCIYICGCSGSGKSTWISNYAENFQSMYPKSPIFFISAKNVKDDEAYEGIKIKQLDIDVEQLEEIVDEGSAYKYFEGKPNSLVIFDDAEALSKKQQELVDNILHSILQIGRSKNINCIISKHVLNNGQKSKVIFNECNKIVVFPNGISRYQLNYTMKQYLGFDKEQINKTLNLKSRWILINNHLPRYILSEHNLFLI